MTTQETAGGGREITRSVASHWPVIVSTVACLCLLWAGASPLRTAQAATALDRSAKAAYLYKFPSYVEWPAAAMPQPDTPLVIGVLGADDILEELQKLAADRTLHNRPLDVRRVKFGDSLAGLHMLFVGRAESARLGELMRAAQPYPILTVSEVTGALRHGVAINLVVVGGRVRFDVALDTAEKNGLKLSSRLLALAHSVRGGGR